MSYTFAREVENLQSPEGQIRVAKFYLFDVTITNGAWARVGNRGTTDTLCWVHLLGIVAVPRRTIAICTRIGLLTSLKFSSVASSETLFGGRRLCQTTGVGNTSEI